jgi:bifunctional enzyme Fae/Hps
VIVEISQRVTIVSDFSGKKPTSKEKFVQLLKAAVTKEVGERKTVGAARKKPTVAGTARVMGVHRDTLYEWLKDFNVKFDEIGEAITPLSPQISESTGRPTYLIGEAMVGEGDEVAHIDLLVGDKNGPVGEAFASGLSNLSVGHTPLLAVIRPNLPPKPHTLLVPKVTVKNMEDVGKIFGPAQAAVAKAIADATEEGIIPREKLDEWVIISSVFIQPNAKDYRRIYHYNYSATKLALKRALSKYPSFDKVIYDKDRAKHPIMGFKVPRLWRPPYLQIALDIPSLERTKSIIGDLPESDRIILEVGTPLLKKYGVKVIRDLREVAKDYFVIADLKTLDVGKVEVDLAFEETADAVVASGLAAPETIDEFLHEAQRFGIYGIMDMMNVENPLAKLKSLKNFPDVVILHRPIDVEKSGTQHAWAMIKEIKQAFKDKKFLVAVAGGVTPYNVQEALSFGADIIIVGRYITQSRDVERATRDFLESTMEMREDIDLFRVHVE